MRAGQFAQSEIGRVRPADANEREKNFLFKIDHFAQFAPRARGWRFRYWHLADMGLCAAHVRF
jgi:hypothetical protein